MKRALPLLFVLAACSGSAPPTASSVAPTATGTVATATPSATPSATPAPPKLADAEQKELHALMMETRKKCNVGGDAVEAWLCPDVGPWREHALIKSGRAESWLFEHLADPKPAMRILTLAGLASIEPKNARFVADKALALKVIEAVNAIPADSMNPCPGGIVLGRIKATQLDLVEPIRKAISKRNSTVRQCFMFSVADGDPAAFMHDIESALIVDADVAQNATVTALGQIAKEQPALRKRACENLQIGVRRHLADPDLAEDAAKLSALHCDVAQVAKTLDVVELWVKAGMGKAWAASSLAPAAKRDATLRKRATAIARLLVETEGNHWLGRMRALEVIHKHDPEGKKYLQKVADGPASPYREEARELLGVAEREKVDVWEPDAKVAGELWRQVDALRACYRKGLAENASLKGPVSVKVKLVGGKVKEGSIEADVPAKMKSCIVDLLKKSTFSDVADGESSWMIGFELRK